MKPLTSPRLATVISNSDALFKEYSSELKGGKEEKSTHTKAKHYQDNDEEEGTCLYPR